MVLTRDKFAFANCVSTRLDFNACKFFNFPKHDNQKWSQACNNERLKIPRPRSHFSRTGLLHIDWSLVLSYGGVTYFLKNIITFF